MAEVQLPQSSMLHQKTMNSRYPSKNILEIRGYSGTSKASIDKTTATSKLANLNQDHNHTQSSILRLNTNENLKLMDKLVDFIEHIPTKSWNEESNEGWTSTGVTSDRSSVYSIDDGDFDKEASRKVNNQLREIEAILYEQNSSKRPILNECKEWLEKFPHLRVLGQSITSIPKEESVQFVESTNNTYRAPLLTPKSFTSMQDNNRFVRKRELSDLTSSVQGLNINGSSMHVQQVNNQDPKLSTDLKFLEEEIFEQEGNYEELLAYDNREDEYLLEYNKLLNMNKRRRRSLPPISPKAAMKDIVHNLLFDHIWSEVVNNSSELIKKYAKMVNPEFNVSQIQINEKTPVQSINMNSHIMAPSILPQVTHMPNLIPKTTNIQFNRSSLETQDLSPIIVPPVASRDSSIYIQTSKLFNNNNKNDIINSSINETLDQITSLENFLKIKQFKNSNNSLKNSLITATNTRIGSGGNRRQLISSTRKRYFDRIPTDIQHVNEKNIFIHGAAVSKPQMTVTSASISTGNHHPEVKIHSTSYLDDGDDDENEYYDAPVIAHHVTNNNSNTHVYHGTHNYYSFDTDTFNNNIDDNSNNNSSISNIIIKNSINTKKQLPPIESATSQSNTLKKPSSVGFRISSAMNSKQFRDRSDRPMTTTATRIDNLLNKRSTTPLMQSINNKAILKSTNLSSNIQITGVKLNNDETNQKESLAQINNKLSSVQPIQASLLYNGNNFNQRKPINRDIQNLRISNR